MINKRINDNKNTKENSLLESGFKLFTNKGIKNTSIQEIADNAGIGKGTFYLYFKDKYDLQDKVIAYKSAKLFNDALKKLEKENIKKFDEQIIFIIDQVINELTKNKILLKFISKNLSYGAYKSKLTEAVDETTGINEMFLSKIKEYNIKLKNPEVTLFMIIELTSSTCFSCILNSDPISIEKYKPFLYKQIKNMLNE